MDGFGTNPFATSGSTPLGGQNSGQSGAFPWLNNNNWWQPQQQGGQQPASAATTAPAAPGSNQAMATALMQPPSAGLSDVASGSPVTPPAPQFDTGSLGTPAGTTNAPTTPLPGTQIGPQIMSDPGQAGTTMNPASLVGNVSPTQNQPSVVDPTSTTLVNPAAAGISGQTLNPSNVASLLSAGIGT